MDNKRYMAQLALAEVGWDGQKKIRQAKIIVVGAGGLGCPVIQYLAGMGVGNLRIIDHDSVHISNLHRQTIFTEQDVGSLKAEVAAIWINHFNKQVNVHPITQAIDADNISIHLQECDVLVDCTDNYDSRRVLGNFCRANQIPLVFGAVQQFEGMVAVFSYKGNEHTYSDLFPEVLNQDARSCAQEGIMGHVAGHVASLMVNEVVKIILGMDGVLSGKVLTVNLKTGTQRVFKLNDNKL